VSGAPNRTYASSDAELEQKSSAFERWAVYCGALVVVGLLLEVFIAICHTNYELSWERWASVGADALVATGVLGEIFFNARAHSYDSELRRRSNDRLSEANKMAAEANERAAVLETAAAAARLETERVKAAAAWRRISTAQHAQLVEQLKGNIKGKVWVEFVGKDPEAAQFHADLLQTLNDSGVSTQGFSGWEMAVGLRITNPNTEDAQVLRNAFGALGIAFEPQTEAGLQSAASDVEIIVGSKPPAFYTNQI